MLHDYSKNQNLPASSEAIRPNQVEHEHIEDFMDVGSLRSFQQKEEEFSFICDEGCVSISFYTPEIVKVVMKKGERKKEVSSYAVVGPKESVPIQWMDHGDSLSLMGDQLVLRIQKSPFRLSFYHKNHLLLKEGKRGMGWMGKDGVCCFKERIPDAHFYGFGERTGFLDKREEKITLWNSDVYAPHNPEIDSLYLSIPFFLSLHKGIAYGLFFDNTYKTQFDLKSNETEYSFAGDSGDLVYYFCSGSTPREVIKQYTYLTGTMPLPPKWALGYHQSRYSYKSLQEVEEVAALFREKEIPCDALYLDIHYMDEYHVFTFNNKTFPHSKEMIQGLMEKGFHVVPIVDPGIPVDPEFAVYLEGVKNKYFCSDVEGNLFKGEVWPGVSVFPDFTSSLVREWWGNLHRFYTELGIEGIWMDMNEPAVFNESKTMDVGVMHENDGNPMTHRALHNVYGLLMASATYEALVKQLKNKRPFLVTRAGFAGIQRFSSVWTGDNRSFWEHMSMSVPMCLNLGISGVPFCGADIGGFAHDATGELLTRWVQLGTFMPFFRNHSALDSLRQEPWSFGEKYESIIRSFIQLRYEWMPYLYTLFWYGSTEGLPIIRPLFLEYPEDENTYEISDAFLLGENVVVAPIFAPGLTFRGVYLPEGNWYDYWEDGVVHGGKTVLAHAGLERIPLFMKEGTILPCTEKKISSKDKDNVLKLHIYTKREGTSCFTLYEDDGETFSYESGMYFILDISCTFSHSQIVIETNEVSKGYCPSWKEIQWIFHGLTEDKQIIVNGQELKESEHT